MIYYKSTNQHLLFLNSILTASQSYFLPLFCPKWWVSSHGIFYSTLPCFPRFLSFFAHLSSFFCLAMHAITPAINVSSLWPPLDDMHQISVKWREKTEIVAVWHACNTDKWFNISLRILERRRTESSISVLNVLFSYRQIVNHVGKNTRHDSSSRINNFLRRRYVFSSSMSLVTETLFSKACLHL